MPKTARFAALFAMVLPLAAFGEAFIVKGGKPLAEIVIAEKPPRMTNLAAGELQEYVEKISGATLPVVSEPSDKAWVKIFVGASPYTGKLGIATDDLKYGAFRMKSGDGWLALVGRDVDFVPQEPWARNHPDRIRMGKEWRKLTGGTWGNPIGGRLHRKYSGRMKLWQFDKHGSLNAVNEFLRGLGVRWYMPGELGEIVPKAKDIALPKVDRTARPDFPMRGMLFATYFSSPPEEILWYLRLGLNHGDEIAGPGGGLSHEMRCVMNSEELKKEHPEYYALWAGKRQTEGNGKPCLSADGLVKENVKFVRAVFDVYDTPMVSVMPQDGYGNPCQCRLCRDKATPERGYHGSMSDYVWAYVDRVAREVYKTHPKKLVSCFAYGSYLLPPEKIGRLSPNVVVGIVHGRGGHFRDPNTRGRVEEIRRRWLSLSSHKLIIWEHYPFTHRGNFWPAYFPHKIAEGLRALKGRSLGEFVEVPWGPFNVRGHGLHSPGFSHLNVYVTARLYWSAEADVDALLDEYYALFYGPARNEMKAFLEYSEANWQDLKDNIKKIERVLGLLAAAVQKVDAKSSYGKRIALLVEHFRPLSHLRDQLAKGREGVPEARARYRRKADVKLDGRLDEEFWANMQAYALREIQTGRQAAHATTFKAAWSGNAIYFGIRCEDADMKTLNVQGAKDGDRSIWMGDCVEILLETQSHAYYQVAVSPAGAVVDLDRKGGLNFDWASRAEVGTHRDENGWGVEIRIPVVIGDMPGDPNHDVIGRRPMRGFPWYFNVCRQRIRDNGTELSAFSPTGKTHFHERMKFGKVYVR